MADTKITGLDQIDEVALGDKIPLVDVSDTTQSAQGSTKYATVEQIMALSTAQANPAVENSYLTVALLLAGQGNQTEGYLQYVADASAHPDVTSGEAYFEYLGTTDGDVDDYRLLSAAEANEVVSTPPINRFFINDIETTTATTVTSGQIHITYENVNDTVTDILFPQDFSGYLADMNVLDGEDVNFAVAIFNRTTNEWLGAVDVSFSVVNTNYYKVSTDKETMPIASITQYDVVEVYVSTYPTTEETFTGTRLTNASVSGSTAIDWNANKVFEFTLTGNTTITDSNLPTGTGTKVIEMVIDGDFTLTVPAYWEPMPGNDDYDGTLRNHLVVSCINGTASSEDVLYSLTNLLS